MSGEEPGETLGFSWRTRRNEEVEILHHGRPVTVLRGRRAETFLARVEEASEAEAQRLMARMTGNYKRGNERLAGKHPRNRD